MMRDTFERLGNRAKRELIAKFPLPPIGYGRGERRRWRPTAPVSARSTGAAASR